MKKLLILLILVTFTVCFSSIRSYSDYGAAPLFIPGIRALGMGGAFLALADDQNAFFYNPAGISQRVSASFSFLDNRLLLNANSYAFGSQVADAFLNPNDPEAQLFDPENPEELLNYINDNMLNRTFRFYGGSPANLSFISPPLGYFSIGIGIFLSSINVETRMTTVGIGFPNVNLTANIDSAIIIPIAYSLGDNVILGASAKAINRNRIVVENTSLVDFLDFETGEFMSFPNALLGWGYGFDAGVLLHLGSQFTIGATMKDIGGTKITYTHEIESEEPYDTSKLATHVEETIPSRINAGIAYVFSNEQLPMGDNVTFTAQYDDITGETEEVDRGVIVMRWKNLHVGLELAWNILSLRLGLNEGYVTAGFGVFLGPLKFDYAYYGEEVGLYADDESQFNHFISLAVRFN